MRESTMERIRQYVNGHVREAFDVHFDRSHLGISAHLREYLDAKFREHLSVFDHTRSVKPEGHVYRQPSDVYREVKCPYCTLHFRIYVADKKFPGEVVLEADRQVNHWRSEHMKTAHPLGPKPKKACECCGHIEGT